MSIHRTSSGLADSGPPVDRAPPAANGSTRRRPIVLSSREGIASAKRAADTSASDSVWSPSEVAEWEARLATALPIAQGLIDDHLKRTFDALDGMPQSPASSVLRREVSISQGIFSALVGVIASVKAETLASIGFEEARRRKLEERVAALEARPMLEYTGTWTPTKEYRPGQFTTCDGGLWHCEIRGRGEKPGTGKSWKLAVKSPRPRA